MAQGGHSRHASFAEQEPYRVRRSLEDRRLVGVGNRTASPRPTQSRSPPLIKESHGPAKDSVGHLDFPFQPHRPKANASEAAGDTVGKDRLLGVERRYREATRRTGPTV
jgi:hypothetical protein